MISIRESAGKECTSAPELGASKRIKKVIEKDFSGTNVGACFDDKNGVIYVPSFREENAIPLRLHEQLHALYTTKEIKMCQTCVGSAPHVAHRFRFGITKQIAEDIRIHSIALRDFAYQPNIIEEIYNLANMSAPVLTPQGIENLKANPETQLTYVLTILRAMRIPHAEELSGVPVMKRSEVRRISTELKSFTEYTSKIVKLFQRLEDIIIPPEPPEEEEGTLDEESDKRSLLKKEDEEFKTTFIERTLAIPMRIEDLPKKRNKNVSKMMKKTKVHSTQGVEIGTLENLRTDGRVFTSKKFRRQKGGIIVLDASGSMELTQADIERLALNAPAATIAYYCGQDNKGVLYIAAKNGKVCESFPRVGQQNEIDIQVLRWMGKQKGPRVWITDGVVTGYGDRCDSRLDRMCEIECEKHQIKVVDSIEEALTL